MAKAKAKATKAADAANATAAAPAAYATQAAPNPCDIATAIRESGSGVADIVRAVQRILDVFHAFRRAF